MVEIYGVALGISAIFARHFVNFHPKKGSYLKNKRGFTAAMLEISNEVSHCPI